MLGVLKKEMSERLAGKSVEKCTSPGSILLFLSREIYMLSKGRLV